METDRMPTEQRRKLYEMRRELLLLLVPAGCLRQSLAMDAVCTDDEEKLAFYIKHWTDFPPLHPIQPEVES